MIVSGLEERIGPARQIGGSDDWPSAAVMPAHWKDLEAPSPGAGEALFLRRPLPIWTFATEFGVVDRSISLQRQEPGQAPALLVRWRNRSQHAVRLRVRPLLGWCNVDHLPPADESFDDTVTAKGASWGFRPTAELPHLWMTCDGVAAFEGESAWYRGFLYAADRLRGYDHVGDRWSPGVLEMDLAAGQEATVGFALEEPCASPGAAFDAQLAAATRDWQIASQQEHGLIARLELGADDFLYRGVGERLGVLAGFPWFGEWGRDVFLALPGLTLARGRVDLCVEVLTGCLPFLKDGLLPNIYGEDIASSHYGSCDAALWFGLAAVRFAEGGYDAELVQQRLVPAVLGIVEAYERGTDLGLQVSPDGMLQAGGEDLNATWMDAQTSDGPVTPREGLPVEIQAVWYALLDFLCEQEVAGASRLVELRDRCGAAFLKAFWLTDDESLADRVHDGEVDRAIRPNMLVAAALSRSPLSQSQRQGVVAKAEEHLVTPCGLRTLSPADPNYVGVYGGGLEGRDRAYHQGTVWPWPAGFYVEAALRSVPASARQQRAGRLMAWLLVLLEKELGRAGLDHVSEVFDGDPPHRPGGTFAQAWNTGELLRAYAMCQQICAGQTTEIL